MTSQKLLDDPLRGRAVDRLESGESRAEEARCVQMAQKWSIVHGINSKQVVLSTWKKYQGWEPGSLCQAFMGANYIFQGDKARQHRAHIFDEFHERIDIHHLECPSKFMDLNPTELI
ncbi:hypothetical protein TNCV_4901631 [Trichonephila clavipes]|nr:hypothetical protein TNCV_4901631 [Trichonephila clavipes]